MQHSKSKEISMSIPATPYISVPIPEYLYLELAKSYSPDVSSKVAKILSDHIVAKSKSTDTRDVNEATFTWLPLSLPSGTKLRTTYYREHLVADIIDGKLIWNDKVYPSVCELINTMRGGTRNNAWRCTEIKYPNSSSWVLADRLRTDEAYRLLSDLL